MLTPSPRRVLSLTTATLLSAACVAPAALAETEVEALRREIQSMQTQLGALQDASASSLNAATAEAMADAGERISFADAVVPTAGNDGKGAFIQNADGSFSLMVNGQVQVRYIANIRSGAGDEDYLGGTQLRRTKLKFKGHIADPRITYGLVLGANRDTNDVAAEVVMVGYQFDNGVQLHAGRMKAPFSFDELTSSSRQQAVERSYVSEQFNIGYAEGVQATFKPADGSKVRVMINDGAFSGESNNGDFNETPTDFAITARGDVVVMGDKSGKFAKDYSSWSKDEASLNLGAAVHFQADDDANTTFADDTYAATFDALYNEGGRSLFGAVYFGDNGTDDSFGFLAQGGINIDDKYEPFARFEFVDDGANETSLITVGVNYFINKHSAKFTLDGVLALDELTSVSDGFGLEEDAAGEDGQVALRAQFQLLF